MGNCPAKGTLICPSVDCNKNPPIEYYDSPTYTPIPCTNACSVPWVATSTGGSFIEAKIGECRLLQGISDGVSLCDQSVNWCQSDTAGNFNWNSSIAWNQASTQSCIANLGRTVCYKSGNYIPIAKSNPVQPFTFNGLPSDNIQVYTFSVNDFNLFSNFGQYLLTLSGVIEEIAKIFGKDIHLIPDQLVNLQHVNITMTFYVDTVNNPGQLFLGNGTNEPMQAIKIDIPDIETWLPSLASVLSTINGFKFPIQINSYISIPVFFDLYDTSNMNNSTPTFPNPGKIYYISPSQDFTDGISELLQGFDPVLALSITNKVAFYRNFVGQGHSIQLEPGITNYVGYGGLYLLQGVNPQICIDLGVYNSGSNLINPIFLNAIPASIIPLFVVNTIVPTQKLLMLYLAIFAIFIMLLLLCVWWVEI